MSAQSTTNIKIVFGAMTIGQAGMPGCHQTTPSDVKDIMDAFQRHEHSEVDTSRTYAKGTSEALLGESNWQSRGLRVSTKIYPTAGKGMDDENYTLGAEDVRRALTRSLDALKSDKVDIWYLHAPDRTTPLEVTMREVDKLYREGRFERLGISNFMSWEVAQLCEICRANGWVRPTVYQGVYNPLHRAIEAELLPCLRFYGIALYSFQPLAGGLLTGRYTYDTKAFEAGSRFDPNNAQSKSMNARYWDERTFEGLEIIGEAALRHDLTIPQCTFRWLMHHSALRKESGDTVLVGASRVQQLESNLVDLEQGPLPDDVVEAMEKAWSHIQEPVRKYWH